MKRLAALLMACLMMTVSCAYAAEDYTVAEKLFKQLWAGSGFQGTLSLALELEGVRTREPVRMNVDYIYVRPSETAEEEHRVDLSLLKGEAPVSAAALQLKEDALSFQADLLSPDWYTLRLSQNLTSATQTLESAVDERLSQVGVASLARMVAPLALSLSGNVALEEALEPYKTHVDVWLEGYRQDAVLSKREDGGNIMEVNYVLPPAAVKAQVKQLALDLLNDESLVTALTDALGEETALRYTNPALQSWYFHAVDALPLTGDLTLSRTVSLKGGTLALHLSLPLYDPQSGPVTLTYDRAKGAGDLPDDNVIGVVCGESMTTLTYQEYSSMTGVKVLQGSLTSGEGDALGFTLKLEEAESRDEFERDVYARNVNLTLRPSDAEESDIAFTSRFVSRELKSASTDVEATLRLARGEQAISLELTGSTRKKWEPEPLPTERVELAELTQTDRAAISADALLRLTALLAGQLEVDAPEAAPTAAPSDD